MSTSTWTDHRFLWPIGRLDAAVLRLWLWTRVAVFLSVVAGGWMLTANLDKDPAPFETLWAGWDTEHYLTIAQWGYDGAPGIGQKVPLEAFFPGLPIVLNVLHGSTGIPFVWVGLLVSFIAGGVAAVALARIAALEWGEGSGADKLAERTVLIFLTAPAAVFLAAVYTESIFLAFALPAWLAARRGQWMRAGLLGAAASTFRMTGLFLALALIVEFVCARDGRRQWSAAPALALPFVPLALYSAFLYRRTGDWLYWQEALEKGWNRHTVPPWEGFSFSVQAMFNGRHRTDFAWMYGLDIVFVLAGVAVAVWLVRGRRWAEATYVGLQVLTLACCPYWQSIDRYALAWWPMWIGLALWTLRRPALYTAWLVLAAPLMVILALMFSTGRWAG